MELYNVEHYQLIIQKTKIFKGYIDGDDVDKIIFDLNDLLSDETNYSPLLDELYEMLNAMHCEHGLDYGSTKSEWKSTSWKILNSFSNGYVRNEENLNKLIALIIEDRKI
jgi:hypothetical protein